VFASLLVFLFVMLWIVGRGDWSTPSGEASPGNSDDEKEFGSAVSVVGDDPHLEEIVDPEVHDLQKEIKTLRDQMEHMQRHRVQPSVSPGVPTRPALQTTPGAWTGVGDIQGGTEHLLSSSPRFQEVEPRIDRLLEGLKEHEKLVGVDGEPPRSRTAGATQGSSLTIPPPGLGEPPSLSVPHVQEMIGSWLSRGEVAAPLDAS